MKFFLCLALGLLISIPSVFGYGNAGHDTIGKLAAHYLEGSHAAEEVAKLLTRNEDLGRAATWADRAKIPEKYLTSEMKEFILNNPKHHSYHYCDVPFQEIAYRLGITGTNPQDVVQMTRLCIDILQRPVPADENPTKITKREALLLVAHFMGDMHQPLHIGCSYVDAQDHFVNPETGKKGLPDAGANNFKLTSSTSLHGYWDTATVKLVRAKAPNTDFVDYLVKTYPPQPDWKLKGAPITWPEQVANETLHLSKYCFEGITLSDRHTVPTDEKYPEHVEWKVALDQNYRDKAEKIVGLELAKAGWRLAEVLKSIWP